MYAVWGFIILATFIILNDEILEYISKLNHLFQLPSLGVSASEFNNRPDEKSGSLSTNRDNVNDDFDHSSRFFVVAGKEGWKRLHNWFKVEHFVKIRYNLRHARYELDPR